MQQEPGDARYHSKCYKKYTAVKRSSTDSHNKSPAKKPKTRRTSSMPSSNDKGLLKDSCIFCNVPRKTVNRKVEPLSECLTVDGCASIVSAASRSSNDRIKDLVRSGIDLIAKEAKYHKSCRREFFKEVGGTHSKNEDDVSNRQLHITTFGTISALIEKEMIEERKAMFATVLLDLYKAEYLSGGGNKDDIDCYTGQALMKKVKDRFGDRLTISMYDSRKGNFIFNSTLSEADARASFHDEDEKSLHAIRTAALHLRSVIQALPKSATPSMTSLETLKLCSPQLPEELVMFFKTLLCGLREPSGVENCETVNRKVMAMTSDAVYNTSHGTVRPWKHTVLGLGLGTLTGSKLVLRLLNRLGYSLSYDEVKALETEFAYTAEANERSVPDGVNLTPDQGTGLAWDNYDVNMETIDGKDTLHATVGICYQNVQVEDTTTACPPISAPPTRSGRNRRQFQGMQQQVDPYYKQLKKAQFDFLKPTEAGEVSEKIKLHILDFYWLLLQSEVEKPIPLFPGFYSQYIDDRRPQQRIWYMDPIAASPTRNDVVRETMNRSMSVAIETKQEYAVVTYDLAVALKAYSIQALDAPLYDKLLVMLGNFHLELAFYGAVGTFLNESGAEHLLTESGVLAEGSLMGFIRGKFYNRCARIHDILALAMEIKLYESFLCTLDPEKKNALNEALFNIPPDREKQEQFLKTNEVFQQHMDEYEVYFQKSMSGDLGPTAQYWTIYIYLINRVHRDLMRAIRTCDVDRYMAVLPSVMDVFFGLNRPNYARWGVLFLNQLKNAPQGCHAVLKAGAFSIRRTEKNFSRSAIDLTLEQTVNRDAASPMRGIVGFHQSHNAIRRWCITATHRGMAVSELRAMTGLEATEQPAVHLRPSRILKDCQHRDILSKAIADSCDPFSSPATTSTCLLNIATGKSASQETQQYLTTSLVAGKELHIQFQKECAADRERFLKPISRRKVQNFAMENSKMRCTPSSKGNTAAESLRDVFIRILVVIANRTNFDLKNVMEYPITKYPLSISHSDGTGLKTDKSKLLNKLEKLQDGFNDTPLPSVDVTLIDGGLLIHSFLSAIGKIVSFGNLARELLAYVCRNPGDEIHVLFDTYRPTSLKQSERKLRGADDQPFVIAGPEQAPRQGCQKLLQNGIFKEQLAQFFQREWQRDHYGSILAKKTLIVSHGGSCVRLSFCSIQQKMLVDTPDHLQGSHEEADTLLAFHASCIRGNVVVRASDTDVLIILLGMLGRDLLSERARGYSRILMDCGSGNTRRHIDVTQIARALESKQKGLAAAIPGLHAFTGSDFTTAFYRKGKVKALEVLEKDTEGSLIKFFANLSRKDEPDLKAAEEFVCSLYSAKGAVKDVNEARYAKLCQMAGTVDKVCLQFRIQPF